MRKRSKHSLSNYKLFSGNMGKLIPINLMEVLPGDLMRLSSSALIRMAELETPVMHPVHVRIHHFFVPNRIIMDDWEDFITGGETGADSTTFPTIGLTTAASKQPTAGSLADYLGVPIGSDLTVNALPFRAYQKIYNEYYRDQNLQTEAVIDTTDGDDTTTDVTLQNVNWGRDRFTSAFTTTQKGTEVTLPLGTEAPIYGKNMDWDASNDNDNKVQFRDGIGGNLRKINVSGAEVYGGNTTGGTGEMVVDLSNATSATINELREKLGLQKFAERMLRHGSRYTEYLRSMGVVGSDGRLDRPEYLGGGRQTIQFSEVLQHSTNFGDNDGVGKQYGHGLGALRTNRALRYFNEHGYVVSLMSVVPKTIYTQGLDKHWIKSTKEDYWQPELQHIGMQAIQNREVKADHATPTGTFGYQDRYDEYRHMESKVAGQFHDSGNLTSYHLGRVFGSDPSLNSSFITCSPSTRIYQDTSADQLRVMCINSVQAKRLVHKTGKPGGF